MKKSFINPFILPPVGFLLAILSGSVLLWADFSHSGPGISFWDALYTATSAVCVTGMAVVEPSVVFNTLGQSVLMMLMQLGGLGIITYSSLIFFMITHKVRLFDRLAVGQALLHDPSFNLGDFIRRVLIMMFCLECMGMLALWCMEPDRIGPFKAAFLSVSAFCNAGFAPWPDNLIRWRQHVGVNVVVMLLIVLGGLGFGVLDELFRYTKSRVVTGCRKVGTSMLCTGNGEYGWRMSQGGDGSAYPRQLSFITRLVLTTTSGLILFGALFIYLTEYFVNNEDFFLASEVVLPAFFSPSPAARPGFPRSTPPN